jgi:CheY-like chemotaxis protein
MIEVLVVDDNPDWQQTLRGLLEDAEYQVITARDESEARSAAAQRSFDLAIIDVRLHGDAEDDESGLSLAQDLKRRAPRMEVVLLTGHPIRADQVVKSLKYYGAQDFIEKSSLGGKGGVDLAAVVRDILDRPSFEARLDQLSLSFELGQPIVVRTRGAHVCALRTNRVCQLSVPSYNRRAQEARAAPNPRFNVKVIGQDLHRDLFENCQEVFVTFTAARDRSQPLCLSFEGARDFIGIPFEFTFLNQPLEEYLILEHPVTRFINGVVPRREALSPQIFSQFRDKLRVLIVASSTEPPIDGVDREAQQLAKFLKGQKYVEVQVDLIPTEEATLGRIREELKNCQAHIFHYAGHGWYNKSSPEESTLFFWSERNRKGAVEPMSAAELKGLLQDSQIHLAYLNCCHGAITGAQSDLLNDDFLGVVDAITRAGVPSTLGFRWAVSDTSAPKLALAFYESLLRQGSPEIALWQARRELAGQNRDDPTWLSPILIHQI